MLKIDWIKIDSLQQGCVTDQPPTIAFALASDRPGESLEKAVITCGDWSIETTDQINNRYGGHLQPFCTYQLKITARGTSGAEAQAEASFATGRLDTPWQGQWITLADYTFPNKVSPVPMTFRRSFNVRKPVCRAWINASALGIYELSLNGQKVGSDYFAPGFTSYKHLIQYQTYDVTAQLQQENTITAVVAGGWAVGSFNYVRKNKISADRQAFLCELHLEYADGTTGLIGTDRSWQVTLDGNVRMAEWYDGETFDATVDLEQVAWHQADLTRPRGRPRLLADSGSPVRVQMKLRPLSCRQAPDGELIFDFGQNFSGVIEARLHGKRNQKVVFRHAEMLMDGALFVKSLRTAKAEVTYICIDGEQTCSPRLTYMGFRYVGVTGIAAENLDLAALVLHSDLESTGRFHCSNDLVNRLHENIRWGGRSNFVDIPTDCPQRDERQGWTGDIAVFARTACYNFDMSRFLDKWLRDLRAEQGRGGGIPMVVPRGGDAWPVMATACWGDSCILVPWAEYLARGNKGLLERQYPAMRRFIKAARWWAGFLAMTPSHRYIWRYPFHFGDWCAPDETAKEWISKGRWVATAYFANSCAIMAQIATLLGENRDADDYRQLHGRIIAAYRKVFTDGKGNLKKEFQTAYVLPLCFNMTEGEETAVMAANLERLVREAGNHLTTGFTGTPHLLFALSDHGHLAAAYDLLLQDTCPSWLYEVKAGATTIWERWDALRPDGTINIGDLTGKKEDKDTAGGMVSFNHYANGAVGDWLYRRIAGIEPSSGGYKTFRIQPLPGGGLTAARGAVQTPYGQIESGWQLAGDRFSIDIAVPVSTSCSLILPNGEQHQLTSGRFQFYCLLAAADASKNNTLERG